MSMKEINVTQAGRYLEKQAEYHNPMPPSKLLKTNNVYYMFLW